MKKYFSLLKTVSLFKGIEDSELELLLSCLSVRVVFYEKDRTVFLSGNSIDSFGIILSGQVQIVHEDYYGNKNILANIDAGHLFGESFACTATRVLPVSVLTTTESEILFIDCRRLSTPCSKACLFHSRLIENMLNIVSMKNIALTKKIEITSKRTTREKLLAYLSSEAKKADSSCFCIPYNRQELADYLSVERSAMSAELSKLRNDGVLKFNKNRFELIQ